MSKVHDSLRYCSFVFPRRVINLLFRLWNRITQCIGLTTSFNRQDNHSQDKMVTPFDSRDIASASYVPVSRPSCEETLQVRNTVALEPDFSIETGFGLDTDELSRRMSVFCPIPYLFFYCCCGEFSSLINTEGPRFGSYCITSHPHNTLW